MTINNLAKSVESCLNSADFEEGVQDYCSEIKVQSKQFSDVDLVLDNSGLICILEGKTTSERFSFFSDLDKINFKGFQGKYSSCVSIGQRRLHNNYSKQGVFCFCSIGENVKKEGYDVDKVESKDGDSEKYIFIVPSGAKDAHPCYHNSIFMHCLFPSHDMKEEFINWFSGMYRKDSRVNIKYEETWTPEKPGGRSLYIYATGYEKGTQWKVPYGGRDNRKILNNIPNKFMHYLSSVNYKSIDFLSSG